MTSLNGKSDDVHSFFEFINLKNYKSNPNGPKHEEKKLLKKIAEFCKVYFYLSP